MSINNSVGLINVNMSWIKQMSIRLNLKYFTGRISIYFDGRKFNVRSVVIITIFRYRHILQNTCVHTFYPCYQIPVASGTFVRFQSTGRWIKGSGSLGVETRLRKVIFSICLLFFFWIHFLQAWSELNKVRCVINVHV